MSYGPIDFLALGFETGKLKGEIMPELLDLVQKKVVRVIDLVVIEKDHHGNHRVLEMTQLTPDLIAVFDPLDIEVSGIIQVEDMDEIAEVMEKGTTAALMLFENIWAVRFKDAVLRADGQVIEQVRIPHEVVEEALAIFANSE
jgi:hypothetical protein